MDTQQGEVLTPDGFSRQHTPSRYDPRNVNCQNQYLGLDTIRFAAVSSDEVPKIRTERPHTDQIKYKLKTI